MNLEILKKQILVQTSTLTRNQAEKIMEKGGIKELKGKSINGTYNLYGKVLNESNGRVDNTYVKIDIRSSKIIKSSCTCERFKENIMMYDRYLCMHIIGSVNAFYKAFKKKEHKVIENRKVNGKKYLLYTKIKVIENDKINSFQCSFSIGEEIGIPILDLREFLDAIRLKKKFRITDIESFDPRIDKLDSKVIDYLISKRERITRNSLKLYKNEIREFISLIDNFTFNYRFIDYKGHVIQENVPVNLALSIKDNNIILRHHNKFPIFLSEDVLFFDRNIYLPKEKQLLKYRELYEKFIKNREIKYKNNLDSLKLIFSNIRNITNDVFLDSNIKELNRQGIKASIIFKEKNRIEIIVDYYGYLINLMNSKDKMFFRDAGYEEIIKIILAKYGIRKGEDSFYFYGNNEEKFEFLKVGIEELKNININCVNIEEKLLNWENIKGTIKNNKENYKFKYKIDGIDIEDFKKACKEINTNRDFLKVNNLYIDLRDKKVKEFMKLINELEFYNNENEFLIDKNKMFYLEERLKNKNLDFIEKKEITREIIDKIVNKEFKRKLVPKAFNGELREYQKEGFRWLNEITSLGFGGILADDMGLGKTVQIIAYILSQKKQKFLIIAKTSLVYNWLEEFKKFAPDLKVGLCHGEKRKRENILKDIKNYQVILTTYGSVKNDIELYEKIKFFNVILDEAQTIKNIKSQIKLALKKLKSDGNIAITGTPIENNLLELWSIFDFIMPGFLLNESEFKKRFIEENNNEELKNLITPFILRRLKENVLKELPDKIEKNYYIELSKEEKIIYKEAVEKIKKEKSLGGLIKLRQLVLTPKLIIPEYKKTSSKIEALKEIVSELIDEGKKILIFSQFVEVLTEIKKELLDINIDISYLDGSIDAKKRIQMVNDFNENEKPGVFLISLMAGGVGINLTSASVVIHFDPWWNPKVEEQASDRAYRYGQKNNVNIIKLIAKGTIEEEIVKLQEEKEELIDNIMDDEKMDGKRLKKLSEEELKELLLS